MKSKLLYLSLLIAVSSMLTGCGDEDRLRNELSSLNSKISQCTSKAQDKYDMCVKGGSLFTDKGSAANVAVEAAAAAARNYDFWNCIH